MRTLVECLRYDHPHHGVKAWRRRCKLHTPFLSGWLLAGLLAALPGRAATTTPISINFSGSGSSTKVSHALLNYQDVGTGNVTPFGFATFNTSGSLTQTSSTTGTASGSLTFTFSTGDSIQAAYSQVNVVANGQSIDANATATISGGTGQFSNATGSINFVFVGVPTGNHASVFSLTGSGSITTTSAAPTAVSVGPATLIFSFLQGITAASSQLVIVNNGTQQPVTFSATTAGGAWLSVSPTGGTAQPSATSSVIVTVNPAGLAAGTYLGTVTVTAAGGQQFNLPVTATVSSSAQSMVLSQTGLLFEIAAGTGAPPGAFIIVVNQGAGSLSWSATASTNSGNWLSVTPGNGTSDASLNGSVTVSADPSNLQPGQYYGRVQFTAAGAANSPQTVVVVLDVLPANSTLGPQLFPTGVVFTGQQGGPNPDPQVVTVTNPSGLSIIVNSGVIYLQGGGWLSIDLPSATVNSGQSVPFTVSANLAGLQAGVYMGVLEFSLAGGDRKSVAILLVVTPPTPPGAQQGAIRAAASVAGCSPTKLLPVFVRLGNGFNATAAWPSEIRVVVVDDCGSPLGYYGSVIASFSTGDPPLPLSPLRRGRWSGTWQPRAASATQAVITVLAQSSQPPLSGTAQISGAVQPNQTAPTVNAGGVVSAASYAAHAPIAPGSLVSIFGSRLATGLSQSAHLPLDTQLAGTQALLAGRPMPLLFSSGNQINAMVPYDVPPNTTQQLIVQQNAATALPEVVTIGPADPGVFTADRSGTGAGIIVVVKPDGTQFLADATHRATAGDAVVIYCEGLGAVNPPVTAGDAAPLSPLSKTTNVVTVTIGGKTAKVFFAGLTPKFAGLYQVNAYVPSGITAAPDVPVVISVAGSVSPPVTLPIQ